MITVSSMFEDLKKLKDGWLDGSGLAPDPSGLDWLEYQLKNYYIDPVPYAYPTYDGGILLEWRIDHLDLSLEVDLKTKLGYFHGLNLEDGKDYEQNLDLNDEYSWRIVQGNLTGIKKSRQTIQNALESLKRDSLTDQEIEKLLI